MKLDLWIIWKCSLFCACGDETWFVNLKMFWLLCKRWWNLMWIWKCSLFCASDDETWFEFENVLTFVQAMMKLDVNLKMFSVLCKRWWNLICEFENVHCFVQAVMKLDVNFMQKTKSVYEKLETTSTTNSADFWIYNFQNVKKQCV